MEDSLVDDLAGDVLVARDPSPHVGMGGEEGEEGGGRPEDLHPGVAGALHAGMEEKGKVGAAEDRVLILQFRECRHQPAIVLGAGGEAVLARGGQHEEGKALDPDHVVTVGGQTEGEVEVLVTGSPVAFVITDVFTYPFRLSSALGKPMYLSVYTVS